MTAPHNSSIICAGISAGVLHDSRFSGTAVAVRKMKHLDTELLGGVLKHLLLGYQLLQWQALNVSKSDGLI